MTLQITPQMEQVQELADIHGLVPISLDFEAEGPQGDRQVLLGNFREAAREAGWPESALGGFTEIVMNLDRPHLEQCLRVATGELDDE